MKWFDNEDFLDLAIRLKVNHLAFTANSVIKESGLVMGAGAALRIRNAYPGIDGEFGRILNRLPGRDYHVMHVLQPEHVPSNIYALQVKRHYRSDGDIELTRLSLRKFALSLEGAEAVLNCPLIGLGGYADNPQEIFELVEEELANTSVCVTRFMC